MLLKDQTHIKLKKNARKILCFSAAYDNTFVMVRVDHPGAQESIVHLNAAGQILYEHQYADIINFFGQVNDREVIVFDQPNNRIDIHNLKEKKFFSIEFMFLLDDVALMECLTFHETRTFCVLERGTFGDHRLRLAYFHYDGIGPHSKPFIDWQSQEQEWTYEMPIHKANNHSKVLWWKMFQEATIQFKYFDFKKDAAGKLSTLTCINTMGAIYGVNNLKFQIEDAWQALPDVYTIFCTSNRPAETPGLQNTYIIDNRVKGNCTIRETKYNFITEYNPYVPEEGKPREPKNWAPQLIRNFPLGNISVYHTFGHQKQQILDTPIFYINN